MAEDPRLAFSISYTTRAPRGAERDGEHYHFISRDEFLARIGRQEFLEWAEVFGNFYGTHQSELDRAQAAGKDLVLDIDVQGARQLRERIPRAASIFILPPSRHILEQRLRARSEDSDEVIERRLRAAAAEIRNYRGYHYVLINDQVEPSVERLRAIITAERLKQDRMREHVLPILETFGAGETDQAPEQD